MLPLTYTVDQNAAAGSNVISDTASVSGANETLVSPSDDSATQSTSIVRNVYFQVTTPDTTYSLNASSDVCTLAYSVTVTNNGPSDASGVQLTNSQVLP